MLDVEQSDAMEYRKNTCALCCYAFNLNFEIKFNAQLLWGVSKKQPELMSHLKKTKQEIKEKESPKF